MRRLFPDATFMMQKQAAESTIKAADRPAILHIATHGFFLDDETMIQIVGEGKEARGAIIHRKKQID